MQDLAETINKGVQVIEEEETVAAAVATNERCKLNDGQPCYTRYIRVKIEFSILQELEMT